MLKKLSLVAVGVMLLALPVGCVLSDVLVDNDVDVVLDELGTISDESNTDDGELHGISDFVENTTVPEDFLNGFFIHYYAAGLSLDTRSNKIKNRCIYPYGEVSVDYYMPREKLQELHDFIIQYDIKSYSGPDMIKSEDVHMHPQIYVVISFRLDGEFYPIIYEASILLSGEYDNLGLLNSLICQIILNSEEYKSLPPGMPIY